MQGKVEKDCKNAKAKKEEVKGYPTAALDEFMVREDWLRLMPIISGNRRSSMIATMMAEGLLEPVSVLPKKVDGKWVIVDGMQRYTTITKEEALTKVFETGLAYRVRDELADKSEEYLKWWILHHGGDRRHMSDYQLARWAYETAEADGWLKEAEKRQGTRTDLDAESATKLEKTETRIMEEYYVSRMPLRIYARIKRIDGSSPDKKIREKIWDIDMKLQEEEIGYGKAWEMLDKIEDKEEKPPKAKFFKSHTPDLDEHAVEVEQAKERDELVEGTLYTPVHSYKPSTEKEIEKGLGVTREQIGSGGEEKIEKARKIEGDHEETMESLRTDAEAWQEKAEELEKKLKADQSEELKHVQEELEMALEREKDTEDRKSENFKRIDEHNKELMEEIEALKAGKKVTDNPYFSHKFSSADVNELYAWLGEGLKAAMEKFGEPVGAVDVSVEFIPKK